MAQKPDIKKTMGVYNRPASADRPPAVLLILLVIGALISLFVFAHYMHWI